MMIKFWALAPLNGKLLDLRYITTLDKVSDSWNRLPHNFRDGGEVEHGSVCLADVACAESKKQQVVDKLLVPGHAQFLRGEPGFHVKLPNPQALVFDDFGHKLNKKWWFSNKIAWKSIKVTFLCKSVIFRRFLPNLLANNLKTQPIKPRDSCTAG